MNKALLILVALVLISSCSKETNNNLEISNIKEEVQI